MIASLILIGCTDSHLVNSSDNSSLERDSNLQCKVDSRTYSAPYKLSPDRLIGVPINDGTLVSINWSRPGKQKVLVEGESRFKSCDDSVHVIQNSIMAKNLFSATKITNTSEFVGANLGVCQTADEGWFFIFKKNIGYIGYAGPDPLPLAVVGMKCE